MRRRLQARARMARRIERPPAHWSLLAICLGGLALLLVAQGLSTQNTGTSATPADTGAAISALHGRAAIWGAADGELVPREGAVRHRVALTFDDGPDPRWTPRIAATLQDLGVPATFFVVGNRVVRHPGIVGDLADEGFGLGNHTFTHADLSTLPDWQRDLQISLTEGAIAGAADIRPRLVRPPYSSRADAVTPDQAQIMETLADEGYLVTLSNFDSGDWQRPGAGKIVRNATPPGDRGGVILFHDGGGDRSQTVRALKRLVPLLERRGFRFVPLSKLAGLPEDELAPGADPSQHLRGELLIGSLTVARWVVAVLIALLIPLAALAVLRAIVVAVVARRHARGWRRPAGGGSGLPDVSIVVPAYNESAGIERAVKSLVEVDYPAHEVVVVDDGSSDGTGEIVERLELPGVRVLRQPNSGKAVALSTGFAASSGEIVVTVDADTVFERETLRRLVEPFADPHVGAAAGNTKVGNRAGMLGRWQHIDYVTGFNLDRRLYDVLQCMPTVPGAVGAFRRSAVKQAGGFTTHTLAEDTDLTIAVGRAGWKVIYVEQARAWTETPPTLAALWRQRYRWSYGTMQAVWKHRRAIWRKEPGKVGRRGLPYLVAFQIALPMLAPLIDLFALYGLLFLNPLGVGAFWLGFSALMLAIGALAFRLDGESLRPLWSMPFQQFAYRQLTYLVVIQSIISAVRGVRLRWQHVERTGEVEIQT